MFLCFPFTGGTYTFLFINNYPIYMHVYIFVHTHSFLTHSTLKIKNTLSSKDYILTRPSPRKEWKGNSFGSSFVIAMAKKPQARDVAQS